MKYKVDFINSGYRRYWVENGKKVLKLINDCYATGEFVLRKPLFDFENNLCKFLGVKHALGVASGTDALRIAYRACSKGLRGYEREAPSIR